MAEVLFEIPEWLDYADYDNYPSESKPTTNADFINYSRNQNKLVGALTSVFLWQPNTNFIAGKIIVSPNMPEGMEAVALTGGFTGTVEPAWESDTAEYQDSGVKWQLRYRHWSKEVASVDDMKNGTSNDKLVTPKLARLGQTATNRLPKTAYSVGNVVYVDSNLSVALKCTQAGTTSNTELDISNKAVGDSVEDGSVVWEVVSRDLSDALLKLLPVGTSIMYMGDTVPDGYLAENGAAVNRTTYAALFAAIGTKYGAGNGSTTFNLPNKNNGSFAEGSNTAGTVKSAGLPDLEGQAPDLIASASGVNVTGVFKSSNVVAGTSMYPRNDGYYNYLYFNAHDGNAIYGNSNTVQPKSVTVKFCIKY